MKSFLLMIMLVAGLLACTNSRLSSGKQMDPAKSDTVVVLNGETLRIQAYVWVDLMPGTGKENRPLHVSVTPLYPATIQKEMIGRMWFVRGTEWIEVPAPGWNGKEIYTAAGPAWSWDQPVGVVCGFIGSNGKTVYVRSKDVPVEKVY